MSADGRWVAFTTSANNLIPNDRNSQSDVVLRQISERPFVDAEGDSLPDRWELDYFGSLVSGPGGDSDNDAFSNAEEWSARTSPVDSGSCFKLKVTPLSTGELDLRWPGRAGIRYEVQLSDSLQAPGRWQPQGLAIAGYGGTISSRIPASDKAVFARVVIFP